MKVGLYTLGCKVNTYESEYVLNELKKNGFTINKFDDINDIYIINTCTVTNTSDSKSKKMIRHARKLNKDACIVALGCFIEYNKDKIKDLMPEIDIIIGNKDKKNIVNIINDYLKKKDRIIDLYDDFDKEFEDMFIDSFNTRTRAFVKIQDGCENFCSYCVIPRVRGKCRSKKKEEVLKEINSLVKNGYKEIILTGIHTGNYGVDLGTSFADLLKEIVKIEGLERLRISSIEITEITNEVLDIIKDNKVIVNHFHIPIQSGSDKVLKLMNRKYDTNKFIEIINKIREVVPDVSITTDIITGHPGENDEEFENTLKTIDKIQFSKLHVFPYSPRDNTPSSKLPQIPDYVKKNQTDILLELSKKLEIKYMKKFISKDTDVLIEVTKDGYSYGHTTNYLAVKVIGTFKSSTMLRVKLINVEYPYIYGEIIKDDEDENQDQFQME